MLPPGKSLNLRTSEMLFCAILADILYCLVMDLPQFQVIIVVTIFVSALESCFFFFSERALFVTKYRRHTDPYGGDDQKQITRDK